ncbi:hypothetical protein GCM10023320_81200 [Pseudonocardia adelaidensis]|uniref:Uncharacterized protein n=1 Tax=Pseudonocardia adelaidensis TaxID=648754 RepID=A0ABP9P756_9PSEU
MRAALPATKYAPPQQQEMVLRQEAREHTPRALVGRVAGSWATYCYDDPKGPVSGGNTLADAPGQRFAHRHSRPAVKAPPVPMC